MANSYLKECHDYLTREISRAEAARNQAAAAGDPLAEAFEEGVIDALSDIRWFLSSHFDLATQRYY